MLPAIDFYLDKPKEIVIVSPRGSEASTLKSVLRDNYLPNRVLVVTEEGPKIEAIGKLIPLVQGKTAMNGKTTAYVCEKGVCRLPTSDLEEFQTQIRGKIVPGRPN